MVSTNISFCLDFHLRSGSSSRYRRKCLVLVLYHLKVQIDPLSPPRQYSTNKNEFSQKTQI